MKSPFLIGKNLILRPLRAEDASGNWLRWLNDPEVCRYNSHGRFPRTQSDLVKYYERVSGSASELVLAVELKEGGVHIGNISLQAIQWVDRSAEFAVLFGEKAHWGKGYSKEAGTLLVEHGFRSLNLHRIYCGTNQDNDGMISLAKHLKMKEEGRRREAIFKDGKFLDILEFGVLAREW